MNLRTLLLPVLAIAMAALTSCTSVVCKQPVGETPVKLDEAAWDTPWHTADGDVVFTRVKDADKGILEAAWVEVKNREFVTEKHDVHLREAGSWQWCSISGGDDGTFFFGRMSVEDGQLMVWLARPEAFMAPVRAGKLKGRLMKDLNGKESGSVLLDSLSGKDLITIEKNEIPAVFDWSKPLVLFRMKPAPEKK